MSPVTRRDVLRAGAAATVAAVAGCTALGGGPSYPPDEYDREMLLPDASVFPDGWTHEPDMNDDYKIFAAPDEDMFVGFDARVFEDVSAAEDSFENVRSKFRDPAEYDLADAAFWDEYQGEMATVVVRDSNVVGQTIAVRQSGVEVKPDRQRAINYAEELVAWWRDADA